MVKRRRRKQRVQLRQRRRAHLHTQVRGMFVKTMVLAVVAGAAFLLLTQGDSLCGYFIARHTPRVEIKAPQTIGEVAVLPVLPKKLIWLWLPGGGKQAEKAILRASPQVKEVVFEKNFFKNVVVVRLVPRKPVVQMGPQALDGEGVMFPLLPGTWNRLPHATLGGFVAKPVVGQWLAALAQKGMLWSQVTNVSDDRMGNMVLDLQTGTRIQWGRPEARLVEGKMRCLLDVLEDTHTHLGGAAQADLRFFDEGRIIVRPKGR